MSIPLIPTHERQHRIKLDSGSTSDKHWLIWDAFQKKKIDRHVGEKKLQILLWIECWGYSFPEIEMIEEEVDVFEKKVQIGIALLS